MLKLFRGISILLGACFHVVASALTTVSDGDINYELNDIDFSATVVASPGFMDSELYIPSSIVVDNQLFTVKTVGKNAFANSNISSVVIAEGIERLEAQSFRNCTSLVRLSLPKSLSYISNQSFSNCNWIADVYNYSPEPVKIDADTFWFAIDAAQKRGDETPKLHIPEGCLETYKNAQYWNEFDIVEMGGSEHLTFFMSASAGGSLCHGDFVAHECIITAESNLDGNSVVVTAIPDGDHEFKSLSVAGRDGAVIHYSFEHRGGDIIATIPFEDGMVVSAVFAEPATYSLQIKAGEGSSYHAAVNAGKTYSFVYEAPMGWAVSSVAFNGEPLDVAGVEGNQVSVTTPALEGDSQLSFIIHDIRTGVDTPGAARPIVRQLNEGVVIDNLSIGVVVSLSDTSGYIRTYDSSAGSVVIDYLPEGIYVIKAGNHTFKLYR